MGIIPSTYVTMQLDRAQNTSILAIAMLPNAQDVQFLGQCGVAEPHKLNENCADWGFRNRAQLSSSHRKMAEA